MAERLDLMLRLTQSLASLTTPDPLPTRLCAAFVRVVEAETGAISLGFTAADRTLLCATAPRAERYEDAQDIAREGPSLEAFRTGEIVVCGSYEDQRRRWPSLAPLVSDLAVEAVQAIPMRPTESLIGVLTVHHGSPAELARSAPDLEFLSGAVAAAVVGELASPEQESPLWTERDRVAQATGMVIAQLGLEPHDALAILRAHAFSESTSVLEISRRVVSRELDFSRTLGPGGS